VDILITAAWNDFVDPCCLTIKLEIAKYKLLNEYTYENENKEIITDPSVKDRLIDVFEEINNAASIGDDHPCILVAGYPHLLNDNFFNIKPDVESFSNTLGGFTLSDAREINGAIDEYCDILQDVVQICQRKGIRIEYVEVREEDGFKGHEVNTSEPWINGIVANSLFDKDNNQDLAYEIICGASLHPNIYGAKFGYCNCFQNKINELEGLNETPPMDPIPTVSHLGSEITMGNYGGEDVEWVVLDETDNDVLLLSKYVLDTKKYNDKDGDTTWGKCSLRDWLNKDFYNNTFSSTEKELIRNSFVFNTENSEHKNDEENTYDYLFLLSNDEVNKFFSSNDERKVQPTDYAFNNALAINNGEDDCCSWWLRSHVTSNNNAACILNDGSVSESGCDNGKIGVRPAMWVSKSDLTFVSAESEIMTRDGDHIIFGHYEQDGDLSNGPEPIEWEILSEEGGKMLIISKYLLDCQPYNVVNEDITWEKCSLRTWLNNDFLNTAFSSDEQKLIQTTALSNPDNACYGNDGGNDTDDKVFCLSVDEAWQYFEHIVYPDDPYYVHGQSLMAEATQYAIDKNVRYDVIESDRYEFLVRGPFYYDLTEEVIGRPWGDWWLRSPGGIVYYDDIVDPDNIIPETYACYVSDLGDAGWDHCFNDVTSDFGVRPALWLNTQYGNSTSDETVPSQNIVVQNASQGLEFRVNKDAEDQYVPVGTACIDYVGACTDANIVIPSVSPDGLTVTSIGCNAFQDCLFIESVVIPDTVTRIECEAFDGCENLRTIIIPDSVRSIDSHAFCNCYSLESIVIPEGVKHITSGCFMYCNNLKSVTLPDSLTEIGVGAFRHCTSLESIVIPEGVWRIRKRAFMDCTSLISINIPAGATEVATTAFTDSGIQTINGVDADKWIDQHCVEDER
jgi:hypothetical protein